MIYIIPLKTQFWCWTAGRDAEQLYKSQGIHILRESWTKQSSSLYLTHVVRR